MPSTREQIGEFFNSPDWTEGEKFIIKWQFGILGDFKTALIEACCRADEDNLERLHRGFPEEVEAYLAWNRGNLGTRFRDAGLNI